MSKTKGLALFRTLRGRLSAWIALTTLLAMSAFAVVSYFLLVAEEVAEAHEPPEEVEADIRSRMLMTLGLVAPGALVVVTAGVLGLARRVLRPLDDVIREAGQMSPRDLNRRFELPPRDDELETLNSLFTRLEAGFSAQASFAFDVSHELRTPLSVVITELEIALRRPRSETEWQASAQTVLAEARKAARVVDTLLRHARAGFEPRLRARVNLQELAQRVVDEQAPVARQLGLTLALVAASDAANVIGATGDADALHTALTSVVANAVRYTPSGGQIRLLVEVGDAQAQLHVDDSGPGVDASEREAIFAAFVRGVEGRHLDAQGADAGTGLGLALARRIVEAHDGRLKADESPLGGARFTFFLPLAQD